MISFFSDAMITVAVNSLTSFASGFVIFMFLVKSIDELNLNCI